MGVMRPELVMKSIVPVREREREEAKRGQKKKRRPSTSTFPPPPPARALTSLTLSPSASLPPSLQVVMAGVLGIYGLIIAVIISTGSKFLKGDGVG
jgi:hypothetical protein